MVRLAALVVRLSAWLAPAEWRARWREEWLGEMERAAESNTRARRIVVRALGAPVDALVLRLRGATDGRPLSGWAADFRDALRSLRRAPWQTLTVFGCLSVGTTLTVLAFAVVNAMTVGDQPGVRSRSGLAQVLVERARPEQGPRDFMMGDAQNLPGTLPGIEIWGAQYTGLPVSIGLGDEVAIQVLPTYVTGDYFRTLGTPAVLGRLIGPADDRRDAPPVVVLGHRFWRRYFGARPEAIDSLVQLGTQTYRIAGVAPPDFGGLRVFRPGETMDDVGDVWLPMAQGWNRPDALAFSAYPAVGPKVIVRLSEGVSRQDAEIMLGPIGDQLTAARRLAGRPAAEPAGRPTRGEVPQTILRLEPFHYLGAYGADERMLALAMLSIAPLMVLLISCANAAGVQLSRAAARTNELAIRVSLGAGRRRVIRLLALETGIIAFGAGLLAWSVAIQVLRLGQLVLPFVVVADRRVLLFSLLLPVGVMFLAGLLPARRAMRFDVISGLRTACRAGRSPGRRFRYALAGGQIGLGVAILSTAAFLVQSIALLPSLKGRFDDDVLAVEIRVADLEYTPESLSRVTRELVDGIGRLPGVTHVGLGDRLLSQTVTNVNPDGTIGTMTLTGEMGPGSARARQVSPSFFGALGLQVIRGRTFEEADSAVAVVNETFMQRLDDPGSVLGLAIPVRGGGTARIIGVVEAAYERAARGRPLPVVYAPRTEDSPFFSIFARAESARRLMPLVRRLMLDLDPRLAPFEIGTAGDLMRDAYAPLFGIAWALGVIGGLALLLAAVGLFGSVSQTTAQRLHEFGVRLALGARPLDIGRLIARETTVTSVAGTLLGLVFAVPILIGLIQTFGRQVLSLEAVGAVVAILAVVVFVASLFPARRAMRTDPMISLRSE